MNTLLKGVGITLLSSIIFSLNSVVIKWILPNLDIVTFVFLRFFFAFIVMLPFALKQHHVIIQTLKFSKLMIIRAVCALAAYFCFIIALNVIPSSEAVFLFNLNALFVTMFSIFHKTRANTTIWIFILLNLFGLACILQPTQLLQDKYIIVGLLSGLLSASATLQTQSLVRTHKVPGTMIVFYYMAISTLISFILVIFLAKSFNWIWILPTSIVGIMTIFRQNFLTQALGLISTYVVMSVSLASIILNLVLDYFLFASTPNLLSLLGMALIISNSIVFVIYEYRTTQAKKT